MGNCSSKPETQSHNEGSEVLGNDWDSFSYDNDDDDMISLHRLFSSQSTENVMKTGTTAGTVRREDVQDPDSLEDEPKQTDETQTNGGNKKVRFLPETPEEDALKEIFSDESLLEKKRRSFNADMKIFSIVYEESGTDGKKGRDLN